MLSRRRAHSNLSSHGLHRPQATVCPPRGRLRFESQGRHRGSVPPGQLGRPRAQGSDPATRATATVAGRPPHPKSVEAAPHHRRGQGSEQLSPAVDTSSPGHPVPEQTRLRGDQCWQLLAAASSWVGPGHCCPSACSAPEWPVTVRPRAQCPPLAHQQAACYPQVPPADTLASRPSLLATCCVFQASGQPQAKYHIPVGLALG